MAYTLNVNGNAIPSMSTAIHVAMGFARRACMTGTKFGCAWLCAAPAQSI